MIKAPKLKAKPTVLFILTYLLAFTASGFSPLTDYSDVGLPETEVFNSIDHYGTGLNWALAQGDNGLIYAGNGRGLSEWDGERWHLYETPNKSKILSLSKWLDGRLYIGTINDFGYYSTNEKGAFLFTSLVENWPIDQRQFGEVISVVSNASGVMFKTNDSLYHWDGKQTRKLQNMPPVRERLFAIGNRFVFQVKNDRYLYEITSDQEIVKTNFYLPVDVEIRHILLNNNSNLIVFTAKAGVFAEQGGVLVNKTNADAFGSQIEIYNGMQASDGYYYVSSVKSGIFILNNELEVLRQYTASDGIGSDSFHALMEDKQGNIWLSGVLNITKMVPPHVYSHYRVDSGSRLSNHLTMLDGKVTIAGEGIYELNTGIKPLSTPFFRQKLNNTKEYWDFKVFKGHFIYAGVGGVFSQKIDNGILQSPVTKIVDAKKGRSLLIDSKSDTVFAGTDNGLYTLTLIKDRWQTRKLTNIADDVISLGIDDSYRLWAGTPSQTVYRIENLFAERATHEVTRFTAEDGLGANNVFVFNLSSGLVIGTNDGVMINHDKQAKPLQFASTFPPIFTTKGQDVFRLHEDEHERIWYRIGGHTGYIKRDGDNAWQVEEKLFKTFHEQSSYKGFVSASPDVLWFIRSGGLIYRTNLSHLETLPSQGTLNIRQIQDLATMKVIGAGSQLPQLDQNSNSIRINFALAEYTNENPSLYRHRMLGSRYEQWSQWSSETYTDFTQLDGNDYQFELEARDNWGRVSSARLEFDVIPAWYLSNIAIAFYILCLLASLLLTGWLTQKWRTKTLIQQKQYLQKQVALRTQEVLNKNKELQQQQVLKDRFFANVSHEFRTPLTLTIEPLKYLIAEHSSQLKDEGKLLASRALSNAKVMLNLVGQVLDINRLESGELPLHIAEYDIAELLRLLQHRFHYLASQQGQSLLCVGCENPLMVYIDLTKIDQALANLIANAIKYSGKNTTIEITLNNQQNHIIVDVKDNGVGISEQDKKRVFERFYQSQSSEYNTKPGTGLGLAIAKGFAELHQGSIALETAANQGCCFSLRLQKGHEHFDPTLIDSPIAIDEVDTSLLPESVPEITIPVSGIDAKSHDMTDVTTILVVDDNAELRHFISLRLSASYRILQAENGKIGFVMACDYLPDLIISDVMMPIMTGLELCDKLKASPITQTIPIILLTAKVTKREVVEGFSHGADDYLSKPFDTSELIMRVNSLLNTRKLVGQQVAIEQSRIALQLDTSSDFTQTFTQHVMQHLNESNMKVETLANLMNITSKTLARRCKKELGVSPGAYVIQIRMQHACNLITEGKLSISEIAYALGYESLAYFSNSFKKHIGKSPSEFGKG